jgi:hypothetical protein
MNESMTNFFMCAMSPNAPDHRPLPETATARESSVQRIRSSGAETLGCSPCASTYSVSFSLLSNLEFWCLSKTRTRSIPARRTSNCRLALSISRNCRKPSRLR